MVLTSSRLAQGLPTSPSRAVHDEVSGTSLPITRSLTPRSRTPRSRHLALCRFEQRSSLRWPMNELLDYEVSITRSLTPRSRVHYEVSITRSLTPRSLTPRSPRRPMNELVPVRGVHYEVCDTSLGPSSVAPSRSAAATARRASSARDASPSTHATESTTRCPRGVFPGRRRRRMLPCEVRGARRCLTPSREPPRAITHPGRRRRPMRCAFAARHHAQPLLIHRMSAQGVHPGESGQTRPKFGSARARRLY